MNNYQLLLHKLDEFIRKYYKNQLMRGAIYAFTAVLAFYLSIALLESYGWFSPVVRTTMFYLLIISTIYIISRWIILPLLHLYRLGKIISHQEAAKIIGEHFSNISDKLLNTLQLKEQADNQSQQMDLVYASINQKSAELKLIPFSSAIDLASNKKYLRYAAIPTLALITVLIVAPGLLSDSTARLLRHSTEFVKPAPFQFTIRNDKLSVIQNHDFTLGVRLTGKEIPNDIYISYNGNRFKLDKEDKLMFAYVFKNVQKEIVFSLDADGFFSTKYRVEVLPNPVVTNFEISLQYPAYLGKQPEKVKNTGDLLIPAGTSVWWKFFTENTSDLKMIFQDTSIALHSNDRKSFDVKRKLVRNNHYSIRTSNSLLTSNDSLNYTINVIPDAYPVIEVSQQQDSASYSRYYFRGVIKDDYGLTKLALKYRFIKGNDSLPSPSDDFVTEPLAINKNVQQEQFFHFWDMNKINVQPGDEIEYYFEVWDNDGVSGNKFSRSQSNIYKAPSLQELAKDADKKNDLLKNDLSDVLKKSKQIQHDLTEAHKQLLNKKNLDYEDRKKLSDILEQQKEVAKQIEDVQKQSRENTQKQEEFRKPTEELAQKKQQLQEMFDKLMSPEMKKMMEELQELLSQLDKQKLQEALDKMSLDSRDLEKELDRALELFKKMELEQKIKETTDRLDKLADEEEKLSDKSLEKSVDVKSLEQEQKELSKEFDAVQKELEDIDKKNKELEYSQDMDKMENEQQDVDKEMQNSEEQLSQGNKKSASKSQKNASDKLRQMAAMMRNKMQQNQEEQSEEDMNAMRALLENLLHFSFEQEVLMEEAKTMDINNPRYTKIAQQQRKLKDDAKMLEDSLLALSKRVMQIQSSVNQEISAINFNIEKSISNLQDRQVPVARSNQQFVMTSANNLALMLTESLDQMQQQMQQQKDGNGSCKKPGKGKPGPSASDVKKMQEKLSQQLKEMKEKMGKQGEKPGEKNQGKKPGGGEGMSEELAKLAAQQEAIRNALKELNLHDNKDAKGKLGDLGKIMQQMEENEKDIVNKRITDATLKRQQDIMTRLLESEKAERERDQEERRESNESKQEIFKNPSAFEEYKKLQLREVELLKTIPPSLTIFYKNLVNSYFQTLEN